MDSLKVISELSDAMNRNNVDLELNMPDFIIATYLYKSLLALAEANKANGEYIKLSAQEEEL